MDITLNTKEIATAVTTAARFAEKRIATLPALTGIALVASEKGITLRATNLETGIDLALPGQVKKEGTLAVPAGVFREVFVSMPSGGTVRIQHTDDIITITSERGASVLKSLPYDDFPVLPIPEQSKTSFSLPGAILRALITSVAGCASPSTVRPELASVLLSAEGGVVKAVATDSFRLAEKKIPLSGTVAPFSMLIPAKNALDIVQTIPDTEVSVQANEHQCAFLWDGGTIVTRLVAMTYPDYAQIIPKTFVSNATLLRKDFESGLRHVAIFSDSFQKVRLGFVADKKSISLASRNTDVGESSEQIPADVSGDAIELSFNHRYLGAPLSLIQAESITLSASGIGRPLVIRPAGDTSFLYLVMPMNQ